MKIIHVLADGTEVEDISGKVIPPDQAKEFYEIISKIAKNLPDRTEVLVEQAKKNSLTV